MERRFRSPILAALLVLTLVVALVPVLSRSARAAESPASPVATSYEKTWYRDENDTPVWGYRPFYNIDEAWTAACNGTPIKLEQDLDTGEKDHERTLTVPSGGSAVIYLNGHTIDHHGRWLGKAGAIFWVENGARLTVHGEDTNGNIGTLDSGNTADGYDEGKGRGGAVRVNAGATLIMDKVNVKNCDASHNGGAIYAIDGANVTLTNIKFSGCYAKYGTGGAVYAERASLTMDNCEFTDCFSIEKDGIIALWDCTNVTLSKLTIDGAAVVSAHGCVGVWATRSSFTLKDSTIKKGHNSEDGDHYGGGLHIVDCSAALVENVTIKDCDSEYGGGIYLDNSKVALKGVTIDGCSTSGWGYGGGIYAYDRAALTTENVTVQNCKAAKYGGGIFLMDQSTIQNTGGLTVKNCSAREEGGGIYPKNGGDAGVTLDGVKIDSCSSDGNGAGIFALNCKLTLNHCDIAYCQANNGGGIYASGNASKTLLLNQTEVHNCFANGSGGGIYTKGPEVRLTNASEVRSNSAQNGGGIYFSGSAGGTVDAKVDSNYASKWGGGIYYNSGNVVLNTNALVRSNVAGMGGGGLCGESGTLTVSTNGIQGNNGAMAGGGLYIGGGTVTVGRGVTLSDNQSESGSGGGIFLNSGTLHLRGRATLSGNRAKQNGGGLYWNGGTFSSESDISFKENKALNGSGGGICFAGSNDYTLRDANLSGNTAGGNGGGIFYDGGKGSLALNNVTITGNHAAGQGGGACINKSDRFTIGRYTRIKDNTCGADKASRNIASNLYLTNGSLISEMKGYDVYVGSDDERSGGFLVASLSSSGEPDLTYLHASDPAYFPRKLPVAQNQYWVYLRKELSHVTVENGTIVGGSEYYRKDAEVLLKEDDAPAGKTFAGWVADSSDVIFDDNPNRNYTSFIMPDHDVTVTATYKDLPCYKVTVEGGSTTGGDSYYAGATVTITAPAQKQESGQTYSFKNWTSTNAGVAFRDETATTTTFVMPDREVTVTANYQRNVTYIPAVNLSVTAPVAGDDLVAPTLDNSVSASVSSLSYQWQGTEGTPVDGKATCNSQYLLMVRMEAAQGYQFPENVSVTFNGQPALSSTLSGGVLTAYYAFPKTGADTVTAVTWPTDFTIKQGETPSLPDRVSIKTQFGTANAAQVTWSPELVAAEQAGTVTYTGTLVPPDGVEVPENLSSKTITVTVKAPDPVGKITIGTETDQATGIVTVTLSCDTPDATIRYTIDGAWPDSSSTEYTRPFTLGENLRENGGSDAYVLRVTASKTGLADSRAFTTIGVTVPKPSYSVTITGGTVANGKTTFEQGALVGIKATAQSGKVFQKWTGSYVGAGTDEMIDLTFGDADAATTTFTMPKGNVSVTAHFVDMLDTAALTMTEPTSGKSLTLPDKAMYNGSSFLVSWTTAENDQEKKVTCTATVTIPADLENGRYFAEHPHVTFNNSSASADEVTVSDGSLTVTKTYTLSAPTGPLHSVTLLSTTDGKEQKLGDYPANSKVTITAPEFENYCFAMWMGVLGSTSNEELRIEELTGTTNGTVTFTMPEEDIGILALYNSLVTEISFTIPAPEAGQPLAQYPTAMQMKLKDGTTLDGDEETLQQFPISWNTTDEKAVFDEQYIAILFATEGKNITPMDKNVTVYVNGQKAGTSYDTSKPTAGAYYVREQDTVQLFNVFPAAPATMTGLTTPEDIHNITPGTAYKDINLPGYVEVQTSCGTMAVPVEWSVNKEDTTPNNGTASVEVTGTLDYPKALNIGSFEKTIKQRIWLDKQIVVPETVATPTAVPTGSGVGEYENEVKVSLYCATPGAEIHYTTDGSAPTTSSTPYNGPITLTAAATTIKAIAVKNGMDASAVATFTYKVYNTYPVYYSYGKDTYLNGKYKANQTVTVTATDLPGKTFTGWTTEDVDLGNQAQNRTITFTMPENEVTLTPQYDENSSIISALSFSVDRVVVGQSLPQTATYTAETSDGTAVSGSVNITWRDADGTDVASGATAAGNKTYTAVIDFGDKELDSRFFSGQPRLSVMSPERNTTARATLNSRRSVTVTFECTAERIKLKEIIYPETLSGQPNGTTLQDIDNQLVGKVKLVTERGTENANVTWNLSSDSSYDSASGAEQSFTLTGTVTIPESIDQNNVANTVTVQVTVSARGFVGAPIASVAAGRYSTAQTVELSSLTPEATIYYTTDGTEPTAQSTPYTAPIQVSTDTTLKAIARKNGMSNSIVSTYVYTIRRSGGHSSSGGQTNPGGQTKPGYTSCSKGDTCPLAAFSDLVPTAWYHNGVHYCLDNGLMSGYGNGIFAPSDTFNRAMMVQVFYNMEKRPAQNSQSQSFDDVADGQWYTDAVGWASANGITTGYGKTFGPNDAVTREQVAQFLYNFARFKGYDTTARAALSAFTDGSSTSSWAQTAMQWAVGTGVLNGKGDGILDPAATATRAEVATMLTNFCEKAAK